MFTTGQDGGWDGVAGAAPPPRGLLLLTCSLSAIMRDVDKTHFWRVGQNIMLLPGCRVRWMSKPASPRLALCFLDQTHYALGRREAKVNSREGKRLKGWVFSPPSVRPIYEGSTTPPVRMNGQAAAGSSRQ